MRKRYPSLVRGTALFDDPREREERALDIHDSAVQGLAEAKLALDHGDRERAKECIDETLEDSKRIITDSLGENESEGGLAAGEIRPPTQEDPS
jgi:hypothetical protein